MIYPRVSARVEWPRRKAELGRLDTDMRSGASTDTWCRQQRQHGGVVEEIPLVSYQKPSRMRGRAAESKGPGGTVRRGRP